ncbi:Putative ABC iron siderophore transporter, fused permease and ATPase domains [Actinomycetales bacterium JB111]|nr:Putative ABC iron siderophore transporter, fused permease and ATPase domains [Actinomycetales bacterium JB111]
MSAVGQVIRRELRTRLLAKSSIISMIVMVAVLLVGGVGYKIWDSSRGEDTGIPVAVESSAADFLPYLQTAAEASELTLDVSETDDGTFADQLQRDEDPADVVITRDGETLTVHSRTDPDSSLMGAVATAAQTEALSGEISDLGGDPAQVQTAIAQSTPQVEILEGSATGFNSPDFDGQAYGVGIATIAIMLFAILTAGSTVATGVVEEKTSRVVEVLLATIKPTQLLAGKVIGIGLFTLVYMLVIVAGMVGALAIGGLLPAMTVPLGPALVWALVWFLVGFGVYTVVFGGAAALVSRQEEIGSVVTPLMFLQFIPFYVAMYLVPNQPDSLLTEVLGYIPFFSPFIMPMRQAFGATTVEALIAVAIAAVTIPILVWISGRIYRRGVLHTGGRLKLTEALKG